MNMARGGTITRPGAAYPSPRHNANLMWCAFTALGYFAPCVWKPSPGSSRTATRTALVAQRSLGSGMIQVKLPTAQRSWGSG